ncbi:CFAP44 isoform 7 [Pan troglodytes]|uniref:Cilia and flagella associated protein 44 n=2 Tax=Homininae TaxID=207598 RepID=F8WEX0_HUMAN|nr:CFAP44 isoform 7 [Pan troglodytes]
MKEPDDQDTDGEKSVTSKSDGKKSLRSSKSESRCSST